MNIIGVLYYLSATVNPVLYNIMSKRYRSSFKRTLCHGGILSPNASYRNGRSYIDNNVNSPRLTLSPYTTNPYHRRVYQSTNSYDHYRDNVFTFSMSKYKLIIGSRTFSRQNFRGDYRHRTSFHYRLSFIEKKDRQQEKEKMELQLQRRKFSLSFIQQPNNHGAKFIFTTNLPSLPPPNSPINDTKNFTQLQNNSHLKHYQL
jgi:hypothetical protein